MSIADFFLLITVVAVFVYWLDSIRSKEVATSHARAACDKASVEFLDDTVSIKKIRLRRNNRGQLTWWRQYQFEFTSTGEYRYKGQVTLLGKQRLSLDMDAWHIGIEEDD